MLGAVRPGGRTEEDPIDSLVYLSFGEGRHVDELRFSVLSAARHLVHGAPWRIVLYTDRAEPYAGLPVDVRVVDAATAAAWAGRHGYVYRAKIMALADSLAAGGSARSVIVDGDTWFRRSPALIFDRLAPGRTLMHVLEGRPSPPEQSALRQVLGEGQPTDVGGRPWDLQVDELLWNSGVVGLHAADVDLCAEAAHLTDGLLDQGFGQHSHTAEMAAFGIVLSRRSRVGECFDVVTHYWPGDLRRPFAVQLRDAWSVPGLEQQQRFDRLWPQRPREGLAHQARFRVKRLARRAGLQL